MASKEERPTSRRQERPLIGITAWEGATESGQLQVRLNAKYVEAIRAAGGVPVVLPPFLKDELATATTAALEESAAAEACAVVANLDGILFSGGADIDSARWDEPLHPTAEVEPGRDAAEFPLFDAAQAAGMPIFGICRGCQVANVALGGAVIQHLPDLGKDPVHYQTRLTPPLPRSALAHDIRIHAGSQLAEILGPGETGVNSMHHQALGRLGRGLRETATSPDGVVEAVEADGPQWLLAVQWHPEELFEEHSRFAHIFEAFVAACAAWRHGRSHPVPAGINRTAVGGGS